MTMKILTAFDSFKGCITAEEACRAAAQGIRAVLPDATIVQIPLSDGGEGLVDCVRRLLPVTPVTLTVHGPLMEPTECTYALSADGQTAYMELAAACGLTQVPPDRRDPTKTTTYGVGEMMADALRRGCGKIVMGIGGSATCDAGQGMLEAMRDSGCLHTPCQWVVACDVGNPLYGPNGAAYVFAPQKGATPEQVAWLDRRLRAFARATEAAGIASPEWADHPGAGAAGGIGYAFLAYFGAELRSGIDIVLDIARFDSELQEAGLVITGEGKSDGQTLMGKVPHGVLRRCRQAGVPVWLLSGAIDDASATLSRHFDKVRSINEGDPRPLSQLLQPAVATANLEKTVRQLLLAFSRRNNGF